MESKDKSPPCITRYAPTPSGHLHLGNAFNFLLTWIEAKKRNAKIILRIDDLDKARCRDEYIIDIIESLRWLDLEYHQGPTSVKDFYKKYSQSCRMDIYRDIFKQHFNQYQNNGFYYCNCSRSFINSKYQGYSYQGHCRTRRLKNIENDCAIRIEVPQDYECQNINLFKSMGDFIIWRKDDIPSYQLASLIDDYFFQVNLIIRGEDLIPSTCAQQFLNNKLNLLNWKKSAFRFHKLLKNSKDKKMSKSKGDESIKFYRDKTSSPSTIYMKIAELAGLENPAEFQTKEDFYRFYCKETNSAFIV